jgi:hypothetical protein
MHVVDAIVDASMDGKLVFRGLQHPGRNVSAR